MKNGRRPDPDTVHPVPGYEKEIYVKPTITNPNIIVGDFTYIADCEFESHVTHHYDWNGDKLMIPLLTSSDLGRVKAELSARLNRST